MKNQLPKHSPGKLMTTSSVRPFEKQIEKVLNSNLKGVTGHCVHQKDNHSKNARSTALENTSTSIDIEAEMSELELGGNLEGASASASQISPSTGVHKQLAFDPDVSWAD